MNCEYCDSKTTDSRHEENCSGKHPGGSIVDKLAIVENKLSKWNTHLTKEICIAMIPTKCSQFYNVAST